MVASTPGVAELPTDECRRLLRSHRPRLGRLSFNDTGWPVVMPMNYVATDESIYFRTAPGSKLTAAARQEKATFEIDFVDEVWRDGWSVLAFGSLRAVTDDDELHSAPLEQLRPWARDERHDVFCLDIDSVSGRRLV